MSYFFFHPCFSDDDDDGVWGCRMAFYGWPVSQCQFLDTPLPVQLRAGIRVLDIRLAVESDPSSPFAPNPKLAPNERKSASGSGNNADVKLRLVAYHGLTPQFATFQSILSTLSAFLASSPSETLVVSIKQEDFAITPPLLFSQLVHDEMARAPGGWGWWFLENRIPRLGEVRGKAVLFSRFGEDGEGWEGGLGGMGVHPDVWPDSKKEGFEWDCEGTRVRTHDW